MQTPNYLPATRYGGPIRSCHGLARALVAEGCQVDVVTSNVDGSHTIDAPVDEAVEIDGVRIHYRPINSPKRLYASASMRCAFEALIPHADAVHINGMFLWPNVQAARAARRANVPYVVTPRGMLAPELIQGKSTTIKRAWISLFERSVLQHASAIHVTAQLEADGIRGQKLDLAPLIQIPNGVDAPPLEAIAATKESDWRTIPPGRRVAFLARLDWKKGIDIAIEAVMQTPDAFLLLAGPDQIGVRQNFEKQIQSMGVSDRIRFVGPLNDLEKWRFLANADVLIVPSLNENFGNTVIEALAVGTPVLCTAEVGAGELARELDAKCFVSRDPRSFSAALSTLFTDDLRRERIRSIGPTWVAERMSWSNIASEFIKYYQSCQI